MHFNGKAKKEAQLIRFTFHPVMITEAEGGVERGCRALLFPVPEKNHWESIQVLVLNRAMLMGRRSLNLGWFVVFLVAALEARAEKVDLKHAVEIATERSPSFDSLKRQLDIAVLTERNATARLLPSLDFSATHGLQDQSPRTGLGPWHSDFRFALSENIYDNGVAWTQRRIARLGREQAEVVFKDQQNKLSLDIAKQYLSYSLNLKYLEIQDKQFQRVKRQYETLSRDYYQGLKTRKDFLRFKSEVSRAEISLLSARNDLETSRIELLRLLGWGLKPQGDIEFVPVAIESVQLDLPLKLPPLSEHLQYRSAQLQKEVAELNADLVARRRFPEWSLSAGVGYGSHDYLGTGQSVSDNAAWDWNALLKVSYNFLDWGIRSRETEIARSQKTVTLNQIDSSLLSLEAEQRQFEVTAGKILKTYGYAKELLELEKVNFDYIEREYRNGKVQYLDLINGLKGLTDAQSQYYSAASQLLGARYQALYHQGKLYDELVR